MTTTTNNENGITFTDDELRLVMLVLNNAKRNMYASADAQSDELRERLLRNCGHRYEMVEARIAATHK